MTAGVPMVVDVDSRYYLKPEAGLVLCSPMDRTPQEPGDAQADQLDIAMAMEVVEAMTSLAPRRVLSSWAGLRTYAADQLPAVGWAPDCQGFFWYVGQGGFGVQTAPALSALGAAELLGQAWPEGLVEAFASGGLAAGGFAPGRASLS